MPGGVLSARRQPCLAPSVCFHNHVRAFVRLHGDAGVRIRGLHRARMRTVARGHHHARALALLRGGRNRERQPEAGDGEITLHRFPFHLPFVYICMELVCRRMEPLSVSKASSGPPWPTRPFHGAPAHLVHARTLPTHGDVEIRVDAAVERVEFQAGVQPRLEIHVDTAIERVEIRGLAGFCAKLTFTAPLSVCTVPEPATPSISMPPFKPLMS